MSAATINPHEAAHFGALAADWWDPHGSSAMLHKLNPVRLAYIRDQIDAHWQVDARERYALAGRSAIDVGCGAGLLAEPLARMGAKVTGVDAAPENIAAAREHAAGQGLAIAYFAGELAARLAPGGLMILSTPNRTMLSKLLLVEAAERVGAVPRGTHDWDQFLKPEELTELLEGAGLEVIDRTGLSPSAAKGFKLGGSEALNYLVAARWPIE